MPFDVSLSHLIYAQSLSLFFYDIILQPFDKHLYAFSFNSPHGPVTNPSTALVLYNILGVLLGTTVEDGRQHEYIRSFN